MSSQKSKAYDPNKVENRIYKLWEKGKFFSPKLSRPPLRYGRHSIQKKPFVVTIPPPNITGALHMGHALNNTIQDVLVRYHRMKQEPTLWVPGTDHAGIATQNVVEKELKKQGLTRHDLGREKFVERVWKWKEKYGNLILDQLKKLGCSCDWSRTRFTMDKGYTKAILEAFIHYYKKGYIYRGPRIVNWCTRCATAISDIEIKYEPRKTKLWYLKYGIKNQESKIRNIIVATTRPETMLGDTAVAVNPRDERYKDLIGKTVILPLMSREIPVIADHLVDPEFGTGAVKITPAHDASDNKIGKMHKLATINVIGEDGKMTKVAGKYAGLKITECREKIIEDLKKLGLLEKEEDYDHSLALCDRCGTAIEPLISTQWFVKMDKLALPAIKVVEQDKIRLIPERYKKVYLDWMKNIEDWCISRQLWWGHRLPVWFCKNRTKRISNFKFLISNQISNSKFQTCPERSEEFQNSTDKCFVVSVEKPEQCSRCGATEFKQSEDILDTWFSSALWPFAVFGWPKEVKSQKSKVKSNDSERFFPTTFLSTARDIIYLWVARMIFSSLELTGQIPFKDVYIHSTILTLEGRRMSKSLGTGTNPLDLINKYGADATRFGLLYLTSRDQQAIKFSEDAIKASRLFTNKIWNINRFIKLSMKQQTSNFNLSTVSNSKTCPELVKGFQIPDFRFQISGSRLADKWILSRLNTIIKEVTEKLDNYQLGEAVRQLYDFVWHEFADWYLEISKLKCQNSKLKTRNSKFEIRILEYAFQTILRLLHPFMPFITEHLWQTNYPKVNPLIISEWPISDKKLINKRIEEKFEKIKQAVITARKKEPRKKLREIKTAEKLFY